MPPLDTITPQTKMNKQELVDQIIKSLEKEAENFTKAAAISRADATGEESKAENKYDTRGLEASYLAGAQAAMAAESMQNISYYKTLKLQKFNSNSKIALTAFIELESHDGKRSFYFLGPKNGGIQMEYNNTKVLLITPSSPIGKQLLGCSVGDCIHTNIGDTKKEYEIISVC